MFKRSWKKILASTIITGVLAALWYWFEIRTPTLVLAYVGAFIIILLLLANLGAWFTTPVESTVTFINNGDTLKAIWANVDNHVMSESTDLEGRHWLIPVGKNIEKKKREREWLKSFFQDSAPGTREIQILLWNQFGIRCIGPFWPHTRIHRFKVSRRRLQDRGEVPAGTPLRGRVVPSPHEHTPVSYLLFIVPRPLLLEGLELAGDNSRLNLLMLPVYKLVDPTRPVYDLQGDFFHPLDAAIEAAMLDFFSSHRVAVYRNGDDKGKFAHDTYGYTGTLPSETADEATKKAYAAGKRKYEKMYEPAPLTYSHWLKIAKAGDDSPVIQHFRSINMSRSYYNRLKEDNGTDPLVEYADELTQGNMLEGSEGKLAGQAPSGIIPRFGFALVSLRLVDWEAHESTKTLADALLAKETEFHTAEGTRQKAFGERDAIQARAHGESNRFNLLVQALVAHGVSPDEAARVVNTMLRTENIGNSDITTYVEGGGSTPTSVMVPSSKPTSD